MPELRDQIVDSEYLTVALRKATKSLERWRDFVAAGKTPAHGTNESSIATAMVHVVRLQYSLGHELDALVPEFRSAVEYLLDNAEQTVGFLPSVRLNELCGMVQLLCPDLSSEFAGFPGVGATSLFLLGDTNGWRAWSERDRPGSSFHDRLSRIIEIAVESDNAADQLGEFVENRWYSAWAGEPGWDAHKRPPSHGYVGYWAFNVAAVARLTGTDDSSLQQSKYYPYEAAHYLDQQ